MPTLARWFIRTSFVCLGLALVAGLLLALQPFWTVGALAGIFPIYIHLLVLGWLTQLIFGVAYWMFPKFTIAQPRRSESLGWWTYGLLNLGLLLRAVAEPAQAAQPGAVTGWMLVVSAVLQFAAGLAFVINSWSRVKGR